MVRKKTKKKSKPSKPIGYVKKGKSFVLVFGTKKNPRIGRKKFKTKSSLMNSAGK